MSKALSFIRRFSSGGLLKKCGLLEELRHRGLISQVSEPEDQLAKRLQSGEKISLYCGADPTARSLHIGNIVPLMILLNFYVRGHNIVSLVGGATGRVGDPSGRRTERDIIANETVLENIEHINAQLKRFFENGLTYYQKKIQRTISAGSWSPVDNYDWWKNVSMLEFLSKYGRHIRIQAMLSRDSVSSRLAGSDGLGFNEFTYQILQAYDFFHLYSERNVTVQVGGNDQWGNITAGIDLINRVSRTSQERPPTGITVPLLTTATGEKFGKSAGNAVFIDPETNTPYDIYQFFYNSADEDVSKFLKIFTLLPLEEIESITKEHMRNPMLRKGHRRLAEEVTDLLHGVGRGKESQIVSDIVFGDTSIIFDLDVAYMIKLFEDARILKHGHKSDSLVQILCNVSGCSKSEARRKLAQGGVSLGPSRMKVDKDLSDWTPYLIDSTLLMLRVGKQKCFLIKMV